MSKRYKGVLYLSGPMSSKPNWNFPAFKYWAKYWREKGYKVINPAEKFYGVTCLPWWFYICWDVVILHFCNITHIFMLADWEISTGAKIEILVADRLGAKILYEMPPPDIDLRNAINEEDYL